MPELPEVEVTRRALQPFVEGQTVQAVTVRERRFRWPVPQQLPQLLRGRQIEALQRRGKYLLWRFAHGSVISHLGMSGTWRVHVVDRNTHVPVPGTHDHVDFMLARSGEGLALARLNDPRRFGALLWHSKDDGDVLQHPLLAHLGIEPFDERFDGDWLYRHTRGRSASIKQALLAGDIVVGVGNIYASESLFRAGIHPALPAQRLSAARCARLAEAVRAVLTEAITVGGSTLRDFIGADGSEGYFMVNAFVYGRAGEACKVCTAPVKRLVQGQRATYFCPRCQRR